MCGASDQQKQISQQQQQMYQTLNQNYATAFGQQQAVLGALTSTFQPIMQAGPYQPGYSSAQEQGLNTQVSENVAQNYAAAQKATAQILAARGGDTVLPSSMSANIMAQNTNQAAQQRAAALNQNLINNYNQGNANWMSAAGVLQNVANLQNPNAYASSATSGGSAAANTANQIAQANNSIWNAAIGAAGALGGAALGNPSGIMNFGKGATQILSQPSQLISGYQSAMSGAAPGMYTGQIWPGGVPNMGGYTGPSVAAGGY